MNERTTFIRQLMSHILEGVRIPKLQVERAVGPVLGFFLEDVLTATLAEDEGVLSYRASQIAEKRGERRGAQRASK